MNITETTANAQKTSHTPGPWNVEHPYGEPGVYVTGPNTGLIAKLYMPDAGMHVADKPVTIDANARLIAAAPDLLAIAQRWMEWATGPVVPIAVRMSIQEDTRAAIAKATSQS